LFTIFRHDESFTINKEGNGTDWWTFAVVLTSINYADGRKYENSYKIQ